MANLRDLTVGIDFDGIDFAALTALDNALDEIEDTLQSMGNQLDDASGEFAQMASIASGALNEIQDGANDAAHAVNQLGNEDAMPDGLNAAILQLLALQMAADAANDEIGNGSGMAAARVELLGLSFVGAAAKAAMFGVVGSAALAGIVAAAAPLLVVAGGLGASLLAAGAGAAAFGAVAIPILSDVFEKSEEIAKIEEKIANADTAKERKAAQKELAQAMEGVSDAQYDALDALKEFKSFWGDFTGQFQVPVFYIFAQSLQLLEGILTGLEPTISSVAAVIGDLVAKANASVEGGGLQAFFDWLESNAAEALYNFATIAGNTMQGVFNLFAAFTPIGAAMEQNLVNLTERFAEWSASLSTSSGFQTFVDYAMANGPVLWGILGDIWQVVEDIVVAFAPLGTIVLEALGLLMDKLTELTPYLSTIVDEAINFGTAVAEHWGPIQETVIGLGVAVGSFVAIMKGMQIIGVINTLIAAFRAGTLLATAAQMGLNLAMLANPITWVIAGIAALIAIGVLLYRNWDTVKAKAGELWAKTKEVFGNIYNWGSQKIQAVVGFFQGLVDKFNAFKTAISNFKMPDWVNSIGEKISGAADKVKGLFSADGSHATGLASVPFDGYRAELHRGEAVLTAQQSNALRQAGILGSSGEKPTLDLSSQVAPTITTGGNGGGGSFAPVVQINIDGSSGNEQRIAELAAEATKKELEKFWRKMSIAT